MRPRPVLHETETEIETDYYETETETETKNVVSRPCWSRDLNIPGGQFKDLLDIVYVTGRQSHLFIAFLCYSLTYRYSEYFSDCAIGGQYVVYDGHLPFRLPTIVKFISWLASK